MSRTQLVEKYAASTSGKMLDLLRSPGSTLGPNLRDLSGEQAVGWDAWNRTVACSSKSEQSHLRRNPLWEWLEQERLLQLDRGCCEDDVRSSNAKANHIKLETQRGIAALPGGAK